MANPKYSLGDLVNIKNLGTMEGQIVSVNYFSNGCPRIQYKVAFCDPYYAGEVTDFGLRDYTGPKYHYAYAPEDEVSLIVPVEYKARRAGDTVTIKLIPPLHFEDVLIPGTFKVCECGKEKHGFAAHSRWCPKHE